VVSHVPNPLYIVKSHATELENSLQKLPSFEKRRRKKRMSVLSGKTLFTTMRLKNQ
jgi:hypothetical protein